MQVTDLKAILDYEHNEQWLAALNCYKGIWDHNPTDDVAIRYCFFCWYLIWQWEQIDFPGEDISFEAKITVDNRMGISKAELEHTLSSIACGYYNNFQIEYKCILVHLKRLIPYAFSFSSKYSIAQRNAIVEDHLWCIDSIIQKNRPLMRAARLEYDDVYQQLAIRLIKAVAGYDPDKGNLQQHIFAQLKYELLNCKAAFRLCGMTGAPRGFQKSDIISLDIVSENSELHEQLLAA